CFAGNLSACMRPPSLVHIRHVGCRQVQRKGAAFADRAIQSNFSPKQSRNLPADRETEAGPSIFPCDRTVRLLERFEDDLVFVRSNTDSGIDHRERHDTLGFVECLIVGTPSGGSRTDVEGYSTFLCELEGV